MPFAIQRIQTDRGKEFFAYRVQEKLMEYCIKFRPYKTQLSAPKRQGRAFTENLPGGVLSDG